MAAVGNKAGLPYFTEAVFPIINLEKTGLYKLSVYVFFDCEGIPQLCENSKDFIKFYLNYGPSQIEDTVIFEVSYSDFKDSRAWKRFVFDFIADSKQIFVIIFI